jgi:hypothetical protein
MNKQMANFGRRLFAANMKQLQGGIRVGTGGNAFRCDYPVPPAPCDTTYVPGSCCTCCAGPTGKGCRADAQADPACLAV